MKKNFGNKSKIFIYIFGLLFALLLFFSLAYSTSYAKCRVYYGLEDGKPVILKTSSDQNQNTNVTNDLLYKYFVLTDQISQKNENEEYDALASINQFQDKAMPIYNFENDLSKFNTRIVVFSVISIVSFFLLVVLDNHKRKIYYISNLVGGVALPTLTGALSLVLLIQNLGLMSRFNDSKDLYCTAAYLVDENTQASDVGKNISNVCGKTSVTYEIQEELVMPDGSIVKVPGTKTETISIKGENQESINKVLSDINENKDNITDMTFILFAILCGVIIAYSVFLIGYTLYKYKATAKRRAEILERAGGEEND